jgi:peptidoglycan/LPS O-acetylase OafA/YrhL
MSDMESDIGAIEVEKSFMPSALVDIVKAPVTCIYTISWRALFTRLAMFFLPSFLQGRCSREWTRPAKLHPTAYLDGMRGLAALFVFFCHYSYQGFRIAESYGCADRNWAWLKLPIIRLFYQGPAAVCLFFVISGYALSYRPLKLIRSGSTVELSEALGSLVFRRAIRLFLPPIISTFMIICFIRLGAYEWTREFATNKKFMKNIVEPHPHRLEGTSDQFLDWIWSLYSFIHVFSWNPEAGRISE